MRRQGSIQLVFILPAVLWVLCFTLFPLLYSVRLSLYDAKVGEPERFVGLANYATLARDPRAWEALAVTLVFVACGVTAQMALGLALAVLFNRPLPMRGLLRTLLTAPLFATPIAVGFLFRTILYEEGGPGQRPAGREAPLALTATMGRRLGHHRGCVAVDAVLLSDLSGGSPGDT